MKLVIQRVKKAQVTVEDQTVGNIDHGLFILVGIGKDDTPEIVEKMGQKVLNLRIMSDENDKMNASVQDVGGNILIVSQFTLYADTAKGNRPSFIDAAPPEVANELYEHFVDEIRKTLPSVQTGTFGAMMEIESIADGPVTIVIEG